MELVGLDVGFSATRPTSGVATLVGNVLRVGRATSSADSRHKLLGGISTADMVAIDGPLLPVPDEEIRYCESFFSRGRFQRRCKPGFSHIRGTGRELRKAAWQSAEHLIAIASRKPPVIQAPLIFSPRNIVEAFPNAFLGVCLPDASYETMPSLKRGRKFDWLYDEWCFTRLFHKLTGELADVLPKNFPLHCERNHDHEERAALVCLATAAAVASGHYVAVGEAIGGYFFLPPWPLWADWARAEVDIQRNARDGIAVWIKGARFAPGEPLPLMD